MEVLKSTRYFYPEAPIFVLQDAGSVDFGPLCKLQRRGKVVNTGGFQEITTNKSPRKVNQAMAMAHRFTEIDYSVRRFRGLSGPKPQPKQLWIHRKHATCCTTWMHSKVRRRSL